MGLSLIDVIQLGHEYQVQLCMKKKAFQSRTVTVALCIYAVSGDSVILEVGISFAQL